MRAVLPVLTLAALSLPASAAPAKAAEERGKKEDAERNCNQARSQLRALQDGQRMQRTDPDTGERTVLGDDDRAADIARQQSLIEQWCK